MSKEDFTILALSNSHDKEEKEVVGVRVEVGTRVGVEVNVGIKVDVEDGQNKEDVKVDGQSVMDLTSVAVVEFEQPTIAQRH